ncbi:predicted protein [Nematostella vectensis]|uniref:Major facilitator superfamily associated domain-containing protein n=1 Tax=Nematostella vectensis TaxID=45351 RepID=A7RNH1_NEMVE|nr:major facilitator superfamily domain-containing protein 6-A [Nematostella vectensis]EDO47060.1 predicted protein [Nematostella vectensis]|eukprot:XP_001639123.1 predicted protein [Nematostella vectensis]
MDEEKMELLNAPKTVTFKKQAHRSKLSRFCSINRSTLRYKVFYFAQQLSAATILTFMSVFFRYMGMSATQTGVLIGLRPFVRLLAAPMWGIIADKTGRYRCILLMNIVLSVIIYFSLTGVLAVHEYDTARMNVTQPVSPTKGHNTTALMDGVLEASKYHPYLTNSQTFWLLLVIVLCGDVFYAPILPVMDATVTYWEGSQNFGKQRMFDALGFSLGSLLSGLAMDKTAGMDYFGIGNNGVSSWTPNYMTSFFMYLGGGIFMISVTSIMKFNVIMKERNEFPLDQLKNLLKSGPVLVFLVVAVLLGLINSAATWYVYWFVQDLGGTQFNVGLTETIMSLSQAFFYYPGNVLEGRIGITWFMALVCIVYGIQLVIYSFMHSPWLILLVEIPHGFTYCAMQIICTTYASATAPKGLSATLQTVVYSTHFGLGWCLGSFIGGHCYEKYGARNLFRGLAVACVVMLFPIAILRVLIKKRAKSGEQVFITDAVRTVEYEYIRGDYSRSSYVR